MTKGRITLIAAVAALAVFLIAFGPAPDNSSGKNILRGSMQSSPESLDPGIVYQAEGWSILGNVFDSLLTYKREAGAKGNEIIPDLAEALPKITDGGRTYTFVVRTGVRFAPPVNREVKASDVKYTYDRLAHIKTQGNNFFQVIEGWDKAWDSGTASISGIVADDKSRTITFHLKQADPTFIYSVAVNFSGVTAKGTPARDLSQSGFAPSTGPYMLTKYAPGSTIQLRRNPNFKQWSPDLPKGSVDGVDITIGVSDENATTRIMQGKDDFTFSAIPRSKWPFLSRSSEWKPYLHANKSPLTTYIWMNSKTPPFTNVKVRQAVNWAIDRRALIKLAGGVGTPTSRLLPELMPGSTKYEPYPKQDFAKAQELIKESGVEPGKVTIWYEINPILKDRAQYLQDVLNRLGFTTRTQGVDRSSYSQVVGNIHTKAQIGFGNWGADFPEGTNFLSILAYGKMNHPFNYAHFSGEDEEFARINAMTDLKERATAWGQLDRTLVEKDAVYAPFSGGAKRELFGKRVGNTAAHPVYDMIFSKMTVDGSGTNNSKEHDGEIPIGDSEDSSSSEGGES